MFKNNKNTLIISIVIIVIVLLVSISYLYINRASDEEKIEAISKVKSAMGYSNYPDKPDKVKGIIHGGGPSPGIQVSGEYETKVKLRFNGVYQVTFTEYWNSKDFKYAGSKDGIQNHFTTFEVKSNEVKLIKSGGDFSPEQVK